MPGQLLERERAESGTRLRAISSFMCWPGPADAACAVSLTHLSRWFEKCFRARHGSWASRARVEGLGIEQLRQGPQQASPAEFISVSSAQPWPASRPKAGSLHSVSPRLPCKARHRVQPR